MRYGRNPNQIDTIHEEENDRNLQQQKNKSSKYVGQKEDEQWWKDVKIDEEEAKKQTDKQIYRILVDKMGVFRWQNAQFCFFCFFRILQSMQTD